MNSHDLRNALRALNHVYELPSDALALADHAKRGRNVDERAVRTAARTLSGMYELPADAGRLAYHLGAAIMGSAK